MPNPIFNPTANSSLRSLFARLNSIVMPYRKVKG